MWLGPWAGRREHFTRDLFPELAVKTPTDESEKACYQAGYLDVDRS